MKENKILVYESENFPNLIGMIGRVLDTSDYNGMTFINIRAENDGPNKIYRSKPNQRAWQRNDHMNFHPEDLIILI